MRDVVRGGVRAEGEGRARTEAELLAGRDVAARLEPHEGLHRVHFRLQVARTGAVRRVVDVAAPRRPRGVLAIDVRDILVVFTLAVEPETGQRLRGQLVGRREKREAVRALPAGVFGLGQ